MAELNETMTVEEFQRWMAFFAIEPLPEVRADWRVAMLLAQQANMNRKKGSSAIPVEKFLPRWEQRRPPQTMQQMELALMAQYSALGGKPLKS